MSEITRAEIISIGPRFYFIGLFAAKMPDGLMVVADAT